MRCPPPPTCRAGTVGLLLTLGILAGLGQVRADITSTTGALHVFTSGNILRMSLSANGLLVSGNGTASANLQVQGNAAVTGRLGIGTTAPVSTLEVAGTLGWSLESRSTDGAVSGANSLLLADTAAGNLYLVLPLASSSNGRVYTVKNTGANYTGLVSTSAIDGSSRGFRVEPYGSAQLVSDGSAWYLLQASSAIAELAAAPALVGATADDPDDGDSILGVGDTLTLGFDVATNQPAVSTKAAVDALVDFGSRTFGSSYTGSWSSANTLVLTLAAATGADLGCGNTIAIKSGGLLTNAAGTSAPSAASATLVGSWGFAPTSVGNVLLWLDGADLDADQLEEGLSEAGLSGNSVLAWKDKATSGNAVWSGAKATYIPSGYNGHALLRFDGTASYAFTRATTVRTLFWVIKEDADATVPSPPRFLMGDSTDYHFYRDANATKYFWHPTYTSGSVQGGTLLLNGNAIYGLSTRVPTSLSIISLKTTGSVSASRLTQDRGGGGLFDGDIAEVLLYSDALSDANLTQVTNYLERKWQFGVQTNPIVSASANDPDNGDAVLGNGDVVYVDFKRGTSQPAVSTKAGVDALLSFGAKSLGADYSGTWATAWRLKITVADATGGNLAVGDTITLSANAIGPYASSCALGGDWGGAFRPTDCGNTLLWLDGGDLDGDGVAEGLNEYGLTASNVITNWTDKVASQFLAPSVGSPTYATATLNGNAVVRFDGGTSFSFSRATNVRTIFWVIKEDADATVPATPRFLMGDSTNYHFYRDNTANKYFWYNPFASGSVTGGDLRVNEVVTNGLATAVPTTFSVISLVTTGNVSASQLTQDRGGSGWWDGDIAEVIIYSAALANTERTNVYNYLKAKWGL